jgi:hypothetical protein
MILLTEVKRRPALGTLTTAWVALLSHRRYYRLIGGELFAVPARPDGTMWIRGADYDDSGCLVGFEINYYGGTAEELADTDRVTSALALASGWRPAICPECGLAWNTTRGHGGCFDWLLVEWCGQSFIDTDTAGTALIPLPSSTPS